MIPQHIKLRGFLCYKEEQSIDFAGTATLWMLSGLNGSGKSAIFDAVTYSLFGHHRGGGKDYVELINKDSDSLGVEFDFLLDNKRYRAKRTLKRNTKGGATSTQQMLRFEPNANGQGAWKPIEETGQRREFDKWVGEKIGLTYDTFTSSVLLLQGKAEKLLDSRPEGRREVLASIVDLDRYEPLHQKVDDRAQNPGIVAEDPGGPVAAGAARRGRWRSWKQRAESAKRRRRGTAARAGDRATLARPRVSGEGLGKICSSRAAYARGRLKCARPGTALDADAILQSADRLRELREVLPKLHEITSYRGQWHQADELLQKLTSQRQQQVDLFTQKESGLKQARKEKRLTIENQITRDETRHRDVATHLRQTAGQLIKLQECERQESDLATLQDDLKRLPADPLAEVAKAREAFERLTDLARLAPHLARFQTKRESLARECQHAGSVEQQQQVRRRR